MYLKLFLFCNLIIISACTIQKPGVMDLSLTSANRLSVLHNPEPSSCNSCHESDRPAKMANGQNHITVGDCSSCHTITVWKSAKSPHSPTPSSCNTCHLNDRPALRANGQAHTTNGDCSSCHNTTSWKETRNPHSPVPTSCNTCHTSDRPALKANGQAHTTKGDCVACHTVGAWKPATDPHASNPTNCNTCHISERPTLKANGQAHTTGGDCVSCHTVGAWRPAIDPHASNPTTCNTCHSGDRPTTGYRMQGTGSDTTHYGSLECSNCHKTSAWSFPHTTYNNSSLNFCLPCHYNSGVGEHRSTSSHLTTPMFVWSTGGYQTGVINYNSSTGASGGLGDCRKCHSSKNW